MNVFLSVGEMKSSPDDAISNARGQISLVVSIYEWAFQTIAADAGERRPFNYIRKGDIYIPKTARRSGRKAEEDLYVDNGIHYRVFYI